MFLMMKIICNATLKDISVWELQTFQPQNVTYSDRLYRGLYDFCFVLFFCLNGNILSVRLKVYSVTIFKHHRNSSKGYTPIFINVKNDKVKLAITVFFSLVPNECLSYSLVHGTVSEDLQPFFFFFH